MADSTAIDSLPSNTQGVNMQVKEQPVQPQPSTDTSPQSNVNTPQLPKMNEGQPAVQNQKIPIAPKNISPDSMNAVLSGLQQAEQQGSTRLPSRDIPMNTNHIVQDEQIQPNFIPNKEAKDYIKEKDAYDSMIEQQNKNNQVKDRLDILYDEFQLPMLISVLYFLFQLPIIQQKFTTYFPILVKRDGNMTLGGYLTKSFIFGSCIYLIMKFTKQVSEL